MTGAKKSEDTRIDDLEPVRAAILKEALERAPFEGFTAQALRDAARAAGYDTGTMRVAFPKGPGDLLAYWSRGLDARMAEDLKTRGLDNMRIRDKVTLAVRLRIEAMAEHRAAARRAASTLTLPHNAALGPRLLYETVDAIWRAIGDTSTDFNFYSKRAILAGVYSSTLMVWFEDFSDGCEKTWTFLDHRIENVMEFEKFKARTREKLKDIPSPLAFFSALRYPSERK
jgi:ubiquinone biosynthesis protein COQ9